MADAEVGDDADTDEAMEALTDVDDADDVVDDVPSPGETWSCSGDLETECWLACESLGCSSSYCDLEHCGAIGVCIETLDAGSPSCSCSLCDCSSAAWLCEPVCDGRWFPGVRACAEGTDCGCPGAGGDVDDTTDEGRIDHGGGEPDEATSGCQCAAATGGSVPTALLAVFLVAAVGALLPRRHR